MKTSRITIASRRAFFLADILRKRQFDDGDEIQPEDWKALTACLHQVTSCCASLAIGSAQMLKEQELPEVTVPEPMLEPGAVPEPYASQLKEIMRDSFEMDYGEPDS